MARKAVKKVCKSHAKAIGTGAVHKFLKWIALVAPDGKTSDVLCVVMTRQGVSAKGRRPEELVFASTYIHPSGCATMATAEGVCIKTDTLKQHVLPVMEGLEKLIADGGSTMSHSAIAEAVGLPEYFGCSEGGCSVCSGVVGAALKNLISLDLGLDRTVGKALEKLITFDQGLDGRTGSDADRA